MEECDLEVPGCGRNIDQQKARMAAVTEDEATPGHMGELTRERGGAARRKLGAMAARPGESESWLSSSLFLFSMIPVSVVTFPFFES